jgi:hypothetical protein
MLPVLSGFMSDIWWKAKITNCKSFRHWIIWSHSYTLTFLSDDRDTTFVVNILHPVNLYRHKNIIPCAFVEVVHSCKLLFIPLLCFHFQTHPQCFFITNQHMDTHGSQQDINVSDDINVSHSCISQCQKTHGTAYFCAEFAHHFSMLQAWTDIS